MVWPTRGSNHDLPHSRLARQPLLYRCGGSLLDKIYKSCMQLISKWPFITISYAVSLQKFKLHIWQLSKTFYLYKECKWSLIYSLGFYQFETFLKRWPYNIFSNGVLCRPMTSNDDHCAFLLSSLLTIIFFFKWPLNDH